MSRRLLLTALLLILLILTTLAAAGPSVLATASAQSPLAPPPPPPTRDDAPVIIDGNTATPTPDVASLRSPVDTEPTPPPPSPTALAADIVGELFPPPGDSLHPKPPIYIVFAQPMDQASVEAAFSIEPPVNYTLRWKENVLFINLQQPLARDQLGVPSPFASWNDPHTFTINTSATTADGMPLDQAVRWTYQSVAPEMVADPPLNDNRSLRLHFSVALKQGDVEEALQIVPEVWAQRRRFS